MQKVQCRGKENLEKDEEVHRLSECLASYQESEFQEAGKQTFSIVRGYRRVRR